MELSELFTSSPHLRELLTAFCIIFVDFCGLMILFSAASERKSGDANWAREGRSLMLRCGETLYPLGAAEIVIGRHPAADIRFSDSEISRFHAIIMLYDGKWHIEDLGGKNGVTVGGSRITKPCVLREGDVIGIGKRELKVVRGKRKAA